MSNVIPIEGTTVETVAEQEQAIAAKIIALDAELVEFKKKLKETLERGAEGVRLLQYEKGLLGLELRAFHGRGHSSDKAFGEACNRLMPGVNPATLRDHMTYARLLEPVIGDVRGGAETPRTSELLAKFSVDSVKKLAVKDVPDDVAAKAIRDCAEGHIKCTAFKKIRQQYNDEPTEVEVEKSANHVNDMISMLDDAFTRLETYLTPNVSTGIGSKTRAEGIVEIKRMIGQAVGAGKTGITKGDNYVIAKREHEISRKLREGEEARSPHLAVPVRVTLKIEVDES